MIVDSLAVDSWIEYLLLIVGLESLPGNPKERNVFPDACNRHSAEIEHDICRKLFMSFDNAHLEFILSSFVSLGLWKKVEVL